MLNDNADSNSINTFEQRLQDADKLRVKIKDDIQRSIDILNGEPYGNEIEGKSKTIWKLAKKDMLSFKASINSSLRGKNIIIVNTYDEDSVYKAKIAEKALNYVWNRIENRVHFKNKLVTTIGSEGTAICRVGVKMVNGTPMPYSYVVKTERLYIDPSTETIDEADYIIYKMSDTKEKIFQRKDYDENAKARIKQLLNDTSSDDDIIRGYADEISQGDKREVSFYEYWYKDNGKIKFQILADVVSKERREQVVLKKSDSPFSFNRFPFVEFVLYYAENGIYSKSIPLMVEDEQKLTTGIVRGTMDNIAQSNNGKHFFKKRALDEKNKQALLSGDPVVEVNTMGSLKDVMVEGNFNHIPPSVFNVLQLIETQSEGLSGINKYVSGSISPDDLNAPAGNFNSMMSMSQLKIEDMLENIEYGLNIMLLMFFSIINDFWSDKEIEKYTGVNLPMLREIETEKMINEFGLNDIPDAEVRMKTKIFIIRKVDKMFSKKNPNIDLELNISSQAKKNIRINSTLMLMQNVSNLVSNGIIDAESLKLLTADLASDLDKPLVASSIRNYRPQPNPMAQKMAKAELAEKVSKAQKEQALAGNAQARTELTMTKAQIDKSKSDVTVGKDYVDLAKNIKELEGSNNDEEEETSNNISNGQ